MKKEQTTFSCDCTGCQNTSTNDRGTYPYNKGWVYLFAINFKIDLMNIYKHNDKHFCCREHMLRFIKERLEVGECQIL